MDKKPEIGLPVNVITVYGDRDVAVWDGERWIGLNGVYKGKGRDVVKWEEIKK